MYLGYVKLGNIFPFRILREPNYSIFVSIIVESTGYPLYKVLSFYEIFVTLMNETQMLVEHL